MGVALKLVNLYDKRFYEIYCGTEYGWKRKDIIEESVKFHKYMGIIYSQHLGHEILGKDILISNTRLAINDKKQGNKSKYISLVEDGLKRTNLNRSAKEYILMVEKFDEKSCQNKKRTDLFSQQNP